MATMLDKRTPSNSVTMSEVTLYVTVIYSLQVTSSFVFKILEAGKKALRTTASCTTSLTAYTLRGNIRQPLSTSLPVTAPPPFPATALTS